VRQLGPDQRFKFKQQVLSEILRFLLRKLKIDVFIQLVFGSHTQVPGKNRKRHVLADVAPRELSVIAAGK
jgi:hypothetical protein